MTLSGPNQLWAADITYIRLASEFVYLAVLLDVFSRKVVSWALARNLKPSFRFPPWSGPSRIEDPRRESSTIQIEGYSTFAGSTWRNSDIVVCSRA